MSSAWVAHINDGQVTFSDDGGHSAVLEGFVGDFSLDNLMPDGAVTDVSEVRGAVEGARKGARARPTLTVNGTVRRVMSDAGKLIYGKTSGFVSTVADIGDAVAIDIELSYVGATSDTVRVCTFRDCIVTSGTITGASPANTRALTFEVLGPVVIDGETIIAAR